LLSHLWREDVSVKELTAVVLRFRDLNVPDGQTIVRHNDLANKHGSTWWGWWAQGNEQVPSAAFKKLRMLAGRIDGLDVFLFDSGQRLAFRARCTGLEYASGPKRLRSPDPNLTPTYYNEIECHAWFRFEWIKQVSFEVLASHTYIDVPDFFTSATIDYSALYGKRIASEEELHNQRRTIWFVREAVVTDRSIEVRLVAQESVEPQTYVDEFVADDSTRLLWFSDLHFALEDGHHAFPMKTSPTGDERPLATALERGLDLGKDQRFAGIVVSGDITWAAQRKEYEQARDFLVQVSRWAGFGEANARRLAVAPGNHDLRFSATPAIAGTEVRTVPAKYRAEFERFYEDLFHLPPNAYLSSGRRFLLGRSIPVEIAVLNSSVLEQVPQPDPKGPKATPHIIRFQGLGYVGEDQLRDVAKGMGWGRPSVGKTIRVVVLHHHLVPVSYSEKGRYGGNYSTVLDAGRLTDWIVENRVDVVLHGHQHEPFVAQLSRPTNKKATEWHSVYVVGMGSTGVAARHRPPNKPNVFAILDFQRDGLKVDIRSVEETLPSESIRDFTLPFNR
jgi:3',5'-cyclic AMP phosphodiesterase CpdA